MTGKKVEGNEEQRRAAAREARRAGVSPSARGETTGASKQRTHLSHHHSHEEKLASVHRGKQWWDATADADAELVDSEALEPERSFAGRSGAGYTGEHERVFAALAEAQRASGGEAVYLDEIAGGSGLPREQVRILLHDLTRTHRLVTELDGSEQPDLGPRYEVKPRL